MLDFEKVRNQEMTVEELAAGLTVDDLRTLTNQIIDKVQFLIERCQDGDVTFNPEDPKAHDPYATSEEEIHMPWTLGHVIVHITASSEESAFLAAELARGVRRRRARSRFEVHWTTIHTLADCQQRLEESRRMQLASLDIWPDSPHLENGYVSKSGIFVNPIVQHIFGLFHAEDHLSQIAEIISQAKIARSAQR